jgi:hypothetical protein
MVRTTDKHAKDYIRARVRKLDGTCFNDVKGMKYLKGDKEHRYTAADFKYDMKHGYLEYVHMGFEIKLPQHHTDPTLLHHANHECDTTYDSAMLLSTGAKPLSCTEMLEHPDQE